MLLRSLIILLFSMLAVYSCDAPRLNPLDPRNPDYVPPNVDTVKTEPTYSIEGIVKTSAPPFSPIAGVKVHWPNESKIVQTDQFGNFSLHDVKNEDGLLYFEKDGFFADSASVSWSTDTIFTVEHALRFLPTAEKFSIFTEVVNSYKPTVYIIGFDIEVVDHNGIVDSVIVTNNELGIYKSIQKQSFNRYFEEFKISTLSLSSIEDAVGKDFSLLFIDNENSNNKIIAAKNKISRVINVQNDPISPINQDTVSTTPEFKWKKVERGYKHHFFFEIYTDETNGGISVFEQDSISSDQTSVQLTSEIDNEANGIDKYYWVIWCIDEYNNKNRSKGGTFFVK